MPRMLVVLFLALFVLVACESDEQSPSAAPASDGASPASSAEVSAPPEESAEPSEAAAAGPTMTDESLGTEVVAGGLTEPTAMAFIGEDDFLVTEKSTGEVHRVTGGEVSEPVIDLAVNFFDERGLLGIAVHPEFESNGYVYLYWTSSGEG